MFIRLSIGYILHKPSFVDKEKEDTMEDNQNINMERHEKKSDSSKVAATFIKYATYLIIFFGVLWFLINYILPLFQ